MQYTKPKLFPRETADHTFRWQFGDRIFDVTLTQYRLICVDKNTRTGEYKTDMIYYDAIGGVRVVRSLGGTPFHVLSITSGATTFLQLLFADTAQGVNMMDDFQMKLAHKRSVWYLSGK